MLSCHDLSIQYGDHRALQGLNLEVKRGEICALIGPNGSGKSTALHAMAGLTSPASGQVRVDGHSVNTLPRRQLARLLSFLPQHPTAPEEMTVEQLVRMGRFTHVGLFRRYQPEDEETIRWAIESTGLTALSHRRLKEISGGERQRAWISAALAQEAKVLLLDEPTSFLDIGYQVEVLDLIYKLSRERDISIIMSIHDLNQAMSIADRIALLNQGRLCFDGEPKALAATDLIKQVFRVRGRFVPLPGDVAPHFDVELSHRASASAENCIYIP
ncbi:ABC transporter ATP-binding protein [Erwinia sp. S63]|uniref:ABC transporter ATP-binding protein n=1 Tax=Erwinia sp. S63 TaxID=2769341 RepID=UPI0019094F14|nr:ABC transporter ATP-binding protein [Erwinia sp. S63]MBK0097496.1 ABC transporter ATP-binding protein [Erwinia sp. S63]